MRSPTCHDEFRSGRADRNARPLTHGGYKLRELHQRLTACHHELVRIRELVSGRGDGSGLLRCTTEDKHVWLKRLPGYVGQLLGRDLIPGLQALVHEDVSQSTVNQIQAAIEPRLEALLDDLEGARVSIARRISVEYNQMKSDNPILEPLIAEAIDLTEAAMSVLP